MTFVWLALPRFAKKKWKWDKNERYQRCFLNHNLCPYCMDLMCTSSCHFEWKSLWPQLGLHEQTCCKGVALRGEYESNTGASWCNGKHQHLYIITNQCSLQRAQHFQKFMEIIFANTNDGFYLNKQKFCAFQPTIRTSACHVKEPTYQMDQIIAPR